MGATSGGGDQGSTKLVEHLLTTFKNFHVETLSDMWWTKTRVFKAIVACGGGNDYVIPRSNTD